MLKPRRLRRAVADGEPAFGGQLRDTGREKVNGCVVWRFDSGAPDVCLVAVCAGGTRGVGNMCGAFVFVEPEPDATEEQVREAVEAARALARAVRVDRGNAPREVLEGQEPERPFVLVGLREAVAAVVKRLPESDHRQLAIDVVERALAKEGV